MKKTIYIIGIGGRTGSMFARELQEASNIVGVGMKDEISRIAAGGVTVERSAAAPEILKVETVAVEDFAAATVHKFPDFVLFAVKNPVTEAVKSYYGYFRGEGRFPALILFQNGLSAINDAKTGLAEALGSDADRVRIIRMSLINGVDAEIGDGTFRAIYKLPIRLGFGAVGNQSAADIKEILVDAGIECEEFKGKGVFEMENSKLFTNLIGMAAAVDGVGVEAGLRDRKIFRREAAMLREYVLAIKAAGSGFSDSFCGYPIKFLAGLMLLPVWLLLPFRGLLARIVARGRNRPKDLGEVDYYNGEVVKLGKRFGVAVGENEKILADAKELLVQLSKLR